MYYFYIIIRLYKKMSIIKQFSALFKNTNFQITHHNNFIFENINNSQSFILAGCGNQATILTPWDWGRVVCMTLNCDLTLPGRNMPQSDGIVSTYKYTCVKYYINLKSEYATIWWYCQYLQIYMCKILHQFKVGMCHNLMVFH